MCLSGTVGTTVYPFRSTCDNHYAIIKVTQRLVNAWFSSTWKA
jgi:hypothetical protein